MILRRSDDRRDSITVRLGNWFEAHATGLGAQHCPVKTLTKLTPAEIAALPKHAKP